MTHYDLAVIGAGSGNFIVNRKFADWSVAIIERGLFGGTCLNVGCIPTKMFVYPADVSHTAARGPELGAFTESDGADWPAIRDRVFARIDPDAAAAKQYREDLPNVDVLTGTARFTGPRELVVHTADGPARLSADQVVIATGSRVRIPPIDGLDTVPYFTSDTVMRMPELPGRIAILGGGFIGCEFAHIFSAYGAEVTQVQRGPRLLMAQDETISERFTELASTQWQVRLESLAQRVEQTDAGIAVHLDDGNPPLVVDALLVATGRTPNSDLLDLAATGVEVDEEDRIVVDEHQRTTAAGIWALGDASSPEMLKHVANQDARVIKHNLLHPDDLAVSDHRFVPSAVFSSPQVATVGLTEREALADGLDVATYTQRYGDVAYGWAMADTDHLVKLVADRRTQRLVGAHLVGPQASVLIQPLIMAMSFDLPVVGLARAQYWIHPALAEVVENALLGIESLLR